MTLKSGEVISDQFDHLKNIKILVSCCTFFGKIQEIQRKFIGIIPIIKGGGVGGSQLPIFLQKRHIWAKTNRQELIRRRRREGGREASSSSPCWPPPPSGRCSPLNETSACQLVLIHTLIDTWLMVGYWWEQMCSITPLESYQSSSENYSKQTQHVLRIKYIEMWQLIYKNMHLGFKVLFHASVICGSQIFYCPIWSQIVELAFICLDFQATWKCLWSNNPGGYFQWKPLISMRPTSLQCFFQAVWHLGAVHWGQTYADDDVNQYSHQWFQAVLDPMTQVNYDDCWWKCVNSRVTLGFY